ncbi:CvpA family protein [Thiotrichales bacterium 19S9-12]|nr:CvpA family protein [Thiotrichales bacterium 19S9-11]MCF6811746.1 CvpA family protein [Thiotrichales bacterium 19S9-12]
MDFFVGFNWVDWIFVALIGMAIIVGFIKGFWVELFSLITWTAVVIILYFFTGMLAQYAFSWITYPKVALGISGIVIVFGVWIVGKLLSFAFGLGKNTGIGARFAGGIVSFFKAGVVLVVIINLLNLSEMVSLSKPWLSSSVAQETLDLTDLFQQKVKKLNNNQYNKGQNPDSPDNDKISAFYHDAIGPSS